MIDICKHCGESTEVIGIQNICISCYEKDLSVYGQHIQKDGERIDPKDFYKQEQVKELDKDIKKELWNNIVNFYPAFQGESGQDNKLALFKYICQRFTANKHPLMILENGEIKVMEANKLEDECIDFTGSIKEDGYGQISIKSVNFIAHRVAFKLYNPQVKLYEDMFVCHSCDNPKCINPKHLFLGTADDNYKDSAKKGRNSHGEKHGCAKLNLKQVSEIRDKHSTGKFSTYELGKHYGVTRTTISDIVNLKTWRTK